MLDDATVLPKSRSDQRIDQAPVVALMQPMDALEQRSSALGRADLRARLIRCDSPPDSVSAEAVGDR